MSTVSDIITGIRYDLKDDGTAPKLSDAKIMHFMNRFRIFLAAILFREQCNLSLKKADIIAKPGTSTYNLFSSATDFYADFGMHYSDGITPFNSKELSEYIREGYGSSTNTGSAANYMILGTTLYLFGDIPGYIGSEQITWTAAGWDEDGATWTVAGTPIVATHVSGNTTALTSTLSSDIVAGRSYKVVITYTQATATCSYTLGGVAGSSIANSAVSTSITDYITASTTAQLIITPASTSDIIISAISVKEVDTLWMWYYSQNTTFTATTDSMPYNGMFDEPWRQFVSLLLLSRDEYSADFEASILKAAETDVLRSIVSYSPQPKMIPCLSNPSKKKKFFMESGY